MVMWGQAFRQIILQQLPQASHPAATSPASAKGAVPFVQRWKQPCYPPQVCHFSGLSRASRHPRVSIQRLLGGLPPAISADVLQILQIGQYPHGR